MRAEAIKRWIMIARSCFEHYNFNSVMAIIAGLNHTAVSRLKRSWAEVSERHTEQLRQLETVEMSFTGHMRRYRDNVDRALAEGSPAVPLITCHIQDLFFISDTNPTYLDDETHSDPDEPIDNDSADASSSAAAPPQRPKSVNFDKLYMLGQTIVKIERLQAVPPFEEEVIDEERSQKVSEMIAKLPNTYHDNSLQALSLKIEPRSMQNIEA
jgi:RasGEF domain